MAEPKRIQRKRTKGWRMPEGAVYVGRPSRWGNPIRVTPERVAPTNYGERRLMYRVHGSPLDRTGGPAYNGLTTARYFAAQGFKWDLWNGRYGDTYPSIEEIQEYLAGRDLVCWCPITYHPNGSLRWGECHADVLLEIANLRE